MATKNIKVKASTSPRSAATDNTLETVLGYIKEWDDYRTKLLPAWERDNKLYNNERYKRNFEGVADTFVPMAFSTVESMVAAISTGDLDTDFVPQDIYKYLKDNLLEGHDPAVESEEDYLTRALANAVQGGVITDENLDVLNALYDYYSECGDWDIADEHMVRSGLKIGNGAEWIVWEDNKPKVITVAFPDYVFDPLATNDDNGRVTGRRYLSSLEAMRKVEITDPKTGQPKKRYDLSKVPKETARDTKSQTDKELKEKLLLGSTIQKPSKANGEDDETDQIEVIELVTPERMYTVVNRAALVEDEENFIVSQAKLRGIDPSTLITNPGNTWANYKDESLFIGKSEIATFWHEQERLNDATNQKSDAVTRALLQNYRADPSLKGQKATFSVPGGVIWSTSGQYEAVPPATVPNAAFNEEVSIKNNIREVTATDQIVKGVGSSQDVTATEAKLQVAQSGQRIEVKVRSLERGPLKRRARLALQYVRLFLQDPFIVPKKVNNGIMPMLFDPRKYQYDIEPKVTLKIDAQEKRQQERSEAKDTYGLLIVDPTNNLQEVKKILLPKIVDIDQDEIDRITQGGQMPMQPGMPGDPGAMPPQGMPA